MVELSGYEEYKELMAQRFNRAGKSMFVVALPLHLISTHLPIPDPDVPFEGNRRVSMARAKAFAAYWRENVKWATPPLLLDTVYPLGSKFKPMEKVADVEFGVLRLPHDSASELHILDGQHRILGWKLANGEIATELKKAREELIVNKENENKIGIANASAKVAKLEAQQQRLRKEYVTMEIMEGITLTEHKQMFSDIAVNAKGITASVLVGFDQKNVLNRVAAELADSDPMLKGRVDLEKASASGKSPFLLSAKAVKDLVQATMFGMGPVSKPRLKVLDEDTIANVVIQFLKVLRECFPELRAVTDGALAPASLRDQSLLGSATTLRVLAATFNALAVDSSTPQHPTVTPAGLSKAKTLFGKLAPEMGLPISDAWYETGFFREVTSKAPSAAAQELKGFATLMAEWGENGTPFEPAKPS